MLRKDTKFETKLKKIGVTTFHWKCNLYLLKIGNLKLVESYWYIKEDRTEHKNE